MRGKKQTKETFRVKKSRELMGVEKPVNPMSQNIFSAENPTYNKNGNFLLYLIIGVFAFLLYFPSINYEYTLDDGISGLGNKYVMQGMDGIPTLISKAYMYGSNGINQGSYRPIPLLISAVEFELFGDNPGVGHAINLILYSFISLLLFHFFRKIFNGSSVYFPFFISLLFVSHPIHTEVVASIKSRDEMLSMMFLLGSMLLILKDKAGIFNYVLSGFLFFLALLSKESAVTFMLIIPMVLWFFRNDNFKRVMYSMIPYLIFTGFYFVLRGSILDSVVNSDTRDVINNVIYSSNNFSEKYGTALLILTFYLKLLFYPNPLSWDYSFNQIPLSSFGDYRVIIGLILMSALLIWAIIKIKNRKALSFCILFFFIAIAPVSNIFFEFGATMAERFLFTPSIGWCMAIALILVKMLRIDLKEVEKSIMPKLILPVLIISVFSFITYSHAGVWKNNLSLFESGVLTAPNSARTNFNLGNEYFIYGNKETDSTAKNIYFDKALKYLYRSHEIYPLYVDPLRGMGFVLYNAKKYKECIPYLKSAAKLSSKLYDANFFAGSAYSNLGNRDSALKYFNIAGKIDPLAFDPYHYKGSMYSVLADKLSDPAEKKNFLDSAKIYFLRASEIDPSHVENYIQMGYLYGKYGDFSTAINYLGKGLLIQPDHQEATLFTGVAYGFRNMPDSAIVFFKKVLSKYPGNIEAYRNLCLTFIKKGNNDSSKVYVNQGLSRYPNDPVLLDLSKY